MFETKRVFIRLQVCFTLAFSAYFTLATAFHPYVVAADKPADTNLSKEVDQSDISTGVVSDATDDAPSDGDSGAIAALKSIDDPSKSALYTPVNLPSVGWTDIHNEELVKKIKPARTLRNFLPGELQNFDKSEDEHLERVFGGFAPHMGVVSDPLFESVLSVIFSKLSKEYRDQRVKDLGRDWVRMRIDYAFREYTKYKLDLREPVKEIVLEHFGKDLPRQVEASLRFFGARGFRVTYRSFDIDQLDQNLSSIGDTTKEMLLKYSYANDPELVEALNSGGQAWMSDAPRVAKIYTELWSRLKHSVGLTHNLTIAEFRMAKLRSPRHKLYEATGTAIVLTLGLAGTWRALARDPSLTMWLPLLIVAADKTFYTYYQRAVSATFGQGINYNFEKNLNDPKDASPYFVPNVKFFLMAGFINSVVLRVAQVMGAHLTVDLAHLVVSTTITSALAWGAVGSSARGVFSKFPFQFWIEKLRRKFKHDEFRQIVALSAWNGFWAIGQTLDIYDYKFGHAMIDLPLLGMTNLATFPSVMMVLAAAGGVIQMVRNRKSIARMFRWVDSNTACQSLLKIKLAERQ